MHFTRWRVRGGWVRKWACGWGGNGYGARMMRMNTAAARMAMTMTMTQRWLLMLLALALLAVPGLSVAGTGSVATANVALTLTTAEWALFKRDALGKFELDQDLKKIPAQSNTYASEDGLTTFTETGLKAVTFKYGNREVLEDLLKAGVFPTGESSIKGWSLKLVNGFSGVAFRTFLFKKGQTPVDVTEYVKVDFMVRTYSGKISSKVVYGAPKGPVKSATATGMLSLKGTLFLSIRVLRPPLGQDYFLSGLGTSTGKNKFVPGTDVGATLYTVKSAALHGGPGGEAAVGVLAQGSVSSSAPVLVENVETAFPVPAN